MTMDDFKKLMAPVRTALYNVIGRAVLTAVDNTGLSQQLKLLVYGDEAIDKVVRIQEYGLESNPPVEQSSEAVLCSIGGSRELTFAIKVSAREYRPTDLQPGEVALYSRFGQKIVLKADGSISVTPAAGMGVDLNGAGGSPVMLETMIAIFNAHTHPYMDLSDAGDTARVTSVTATTLTAGTDSATNVRAKTG